MRDFSGKTALVTGASEGISAEFALPKAHMLKKLTTLKKVAPDLEITLYVSIIGTFLFK
jgi:short-subunit dehydrogenase